MMRTYLLIYTDIVVWMIELVNEDYSVFNFKASSLQLPNNGQLFYSVIDAYDPKEAIAEAKRIIRSYIEKSII